MDVKVELWRLIFTHKTTASEWTNLSSGFMEHLANTYPQEAGSLEYLILGTARFHARKCDDGIQVKLKSEDVT